jgi:hypothetical protein
MNKQTPDIKYLNKDFTSFKEALINYAKSYFPDTVNDFSDDSPGTMFMEMCAYVGDVLSFYIDRSVQENFLQHALNKDNIISLAYTLGYRPKVTSTATVVLDCYQQIPAMVSGGLASPDLNYALSIAKEARVTSRANSNITFITQDVVDFSFSSSASPLDTSVYSLNGSTGQPEYYLLKKQVKAIAGTIKTQDFTFNAPAKFDEVQLTDDNIVQIISVTDSDGNKWYEVPYLAQSTIFEDTINTQLNDPTLHVYRDEVPYLLRLKRVQRRFTTRFDANNIMHISFGAGTSSSPDETVVPNLDNIGMGLVDSISMMNTAFDPANFLFTKEYGLTPSNTTLTFTYLVGGGVETNVASDDVTFITGATIDSVNANPNILNAALLQSIKGSVAFNNPSAASGGGNGDTVEDIRLRAMASYPTQLRSVSLPDHEIRALSLPSRYGTVAKAYATKDYSVNDVDDFNTGNPLALSLYVLSYDSLGKLTKASLAMKENLRNYLYQYKISNDAISIKDAYYVNIGVNFEIMILPSYNSREVLAHCLQAVKDYFNISNWQINQPIILADIYNILIQIKGVQSVLKVDIVNKQGELNGYSRYGYDIKGATKDNVVYPALDPMVFEVRYPDVDIQGKISKI